MPVPEGHLCQKATYILKAPMPEGQYQKTTYVKKKLIWEIKLNMVHGDPIRKWENIFPGLLGVNFLYF